MADPIRKNDRRYTYRDYETWPADQRWELIEGVAWNMSAAPSLWHQRVLAELSDAFRAAAHSSGCEALFAPVDVMLFVDEESRIRDAETVVQPDLLVVCDEKRLVDRGCLGPPDIVVEVLSPYTMQKDITVKRELYERAGVREYWIVDPGNVVILIFRIDSHGRYPEDAELVKHGDTATSDVLRDLEVSVPSGR